MLTTCILNINICFKMDGTHILVLKLQLITFNLFRDYKRFVSGRSSALCLPSLSCGKLGCWLDGVVLKRKFEHGSNTDLLSSKANRTVSQGCRGLMHLFTHKHSATKAGENKPHWDGFKTVEILNSQNATGFVVLFLFFLPCQTLSVSNDQAVAT